MIRSNTQQNLRIQYKKYLKTRLNTIRFTGLFIALLVMVLLAIQQFKVLDSLWNCVSILYCCGVLFTLFAQYQDIRLKKGLAMLSRTFATLLYICTLGILILIILDKFFIITL